jgi:hypothetical protein
MRLDRHRRVRDGKMKMCIELSGEQFRQPAEDVIELTAEFALALHYPSAFPSCC